MWCVYVYIYMYIHIVEYWAHCAQLCMTLCDFMDCSPATRHLCPWDFPGKNTGVDCRFLLWGILPTQGSNPCLLYLLHWQADSLLLHHLGSPSSSSTKALFSFNIQNTWESGQKSALKPPVMAPKLERNSQSPFVERILLRLEGKVSKEKGEKGEMKQGGEGWGTQISVNLGQPWGKIMNQSTL